MRKRRHGIAAAVLAALLAGCAGRAIESHELHAVERGETARVHELVGEVHAALTALARILETPTDAPGGLRLTSAVATIETRHADDGDGNVSVLIASGEGVADFSADDRIELTFRPVPATAPAAPGIERLVSFYRGAASCTLSEAGKAPDNGASQPPPLSMALVQAGMAALDGYRCALRQVPHSGFALDSLNVTMTVDRVHSETEGAVFQLGGISLGTKAVESSESIATVKLVFSGTDPGPDSEH